MHTVNIAQTCIRCNYLDQDDLRTKHTLNVLITLQSRPVKSHTCSKLLSNFWIYMKISVEMTQPATLDQSMDFTNACQVRPILFCLSFSLLPFAHISLPPYRRYYQMGKYGGSCIDPPSFLKFQLNRLSKHYLTKLKFICIQLAREALRPFWDAFWNGKFWRFLYIYIN